MPLNNPSTVTIPADVVISYIGSPSASLVIARIYAGAAYTLPINLTGSILKCQTAPTANWTVTLKKNGSSIGTGTINAAATTGTFTFTSAVVFSSGDLLEIDAPTPSDTTITNPSITLKGTR